MGESVPGGHDVVVVDDLDEGLDASAGQNLTTSHSLGDRAGAAVDSNNDGVGEGTGLGGVLDGLNDNSLATSELTLGEDDDLTCLQELDHSVFLLSGNTISASKRTGRSA